MNPMRERKKTLDTAGAVSLFLAAMVLFNFPILSLVNRAAFIFGLPLLYVYIFSAWAGVILLVFMQSDKRSRQNRRL